MHTEQFEYAGVVHSESGSRLVGFQLRRKSGETFTVLLDSKRAQDLSDDLKEQVRIAEFE